MPACPRVGESSAPPEAPGRVGTAMCRNAYRVALADARDAGTTTLAIVERVRWGIIGVGDVTEGKSGPGFQRAERSELVAVMRRSGDLAADYAKQLDTQLLTQATNGITVLSGTNSVTYTQATPTAATLYPKIADAVQQIWTNRFAAPSLIVMAPRRWGSLIGAVDTAGRPLVVPDAPAAQSAWNAMSIGDATVPAGLVGLIQGLPVVVDANIPVNLGVSTDQDTIIVTRREDQLLFEVGAPTVTVDMSSLSDNLNVKIYAYGYFAFTFARYVKGTSIIGGTGLKTPTF